MVKTHYNRAILYAKWIFYIINYRYDNKLCRRRRKREAELTYIPPPSSTPSFTGIFRRLGLIHKLTLCWNWQQ